MDALQRILAKLPVVPLAILLAAYWAYDTYDWMNSPQSEYGQKKVAFVAAQTELEGVKKKLREGEEFLANLETIKARIRQLSAQLESTKAVMSSEIDDANFIRMISLEAKKISLSIKNIRPDSKRAKDYYYEVPFQIGFKGAYVQLLVFLDRIAKLQQVVRIGDFDLHPTGSAFTKYVELEGKVDLIAYAYKGTDADQAAKGSTK